MKQRHFTELSQFLSHLCYKLGLLSHKAIHFITQIYHHFQFKLEIAVLRLHSII